MSKAMEAFGKYLLLERLAAGGMAEVYLAKSFGAGGIGKFVAIKRILPQYSDHEEFISMFKEEAKLVINLNHSNIVSIFDFGVERSQFFLVMEFVEGQNLRQVLNHMKKIGKYFSIDQIVHVAKEVASGLDHAHRCIDASTGRLLNITHRDMSPQNVMLSFEGEVKVVDFGIAKAETQLEQTRSGTIKGKFGYMSPEQAEGQQVDARADIFSLGILLWELLAQDRLFTAENEHAVLKKIKECQIPPIRKLNPAVHPDLEKILLKSLTRDRNLRYQTAEAFAKDLSKYLNTHFADFSKQEFSKFMKQIYNEMYLENRKKLADYTKIDIDTEHTEIATVTSSITGDTRPAMQKQEHTSPDANAEEPLNIDKNASQRVDLSKLIVGEGGTKSNAGSISAMKRNPLLANQPTPARAPAYSNNGGTSTNIRKLPPAPPPSNSNSNWLAGLLLVAAVASGGYFYLQVQKKAGHNDRAASSSLTDQGEQELASKKQKADAANPATVPLNIQSTPSNATVRLNDVVIGTTPVISHVEPGKPFKLTIISDGYLPSEYPNETAALDGYARNVVMMPEPSTGTVVISSPSAVGPNTIVIINGQRVANQLPYVAKVAAGTPVVVTLVNPYAKAQGSETVIVRQNEKRNLSIQINKPATITE